MAVIATIVCVPLLVLSLLWTRSSGPAVQPVSAESAETTATTEAPTTVAPSSTVAPTTAAPVTSVAKAAPTTTAAPRVAAAAPTTTRAPTPAPTQPPPVLSSSDAQFLACVRARESGGNYGIADGSGQYMGAYQFSQGTWNVAAGAAGRSDLIGVAPNHASPADQDAMAYTTLRISGRSPWGGVCG